MALRRGSGGGTGYRPLRREEVGREEGSPLATNRTIVCSVRLQTLLFFSFWYDILFTLVHVFVSWYKWRWIRGAWIWSLFGTNLFFCFVIEPFRLYLGYAGNLGEGVPQLFLYVFVCCACMAYLVAEIALCAVLPSLGTANCGIAGGQPCVLPVERAAWYLRVVFLLAELLFGVRALTRLIQEQSARFFVSLEVAGEGEGISLAALPAAPAGRSASGRASASAAATGGTAWATGTGRSGDAMTPQTYGRASYASLREHQD